MSSALAQPRLPHHPQTRAARGAPPVPPRPACGGV